MKLIIVRHGQSIANSKGITQGNKDEWIDTSLTKKGLEQARKVAERLNEEDIDIIYSSDLKRAKQTAEEINKFHKVKIKLEPRLRDKLNNEDKEDFIAKINSFFKEIEKKDKNAIIVAHGSSCLTLLAITTGSREEGGKLVREHQDKHGNTCVSVVEKVGNNYKIKFIGCRRHLE
jgi:broad specificity phosphatase PhoE